MKVKQKAKSYFSFLVSIFFLFLIGGALVGLGKTLYYAVGGDGFVYQSNLAGSSLTASAASSFSSTSSKSFLNFERDFVGAPDKGKAVVVDLGSLKANLYQDGVKVDEMKVLGKPKRGSEWDVPGGEYQAGVREARHFSRFASAWLPYTVQISGNYMIHGIPYIEKGKKQLVVADKGGIRLNNDDAKRVFEFVDDQTKILVYGSGSRSSLNSQTPSYILKKSINLVPITADAYLVADLDTGEVIVEKNKDQIYPIASVTKLTTALVSLDLIKPEEIVEVSGRAIDTYGTSGNLRKGEKLSASTMLYPLLLESSNDAAEALAEKAGRPLFIQKMNEKVKSLEMNSTRFEDPSGLSQDNVSSPSDLFKLARYIYFNKKSVLDITREKTHQEGRHTWANNNNLIGLNYYIGGKNGYTDEAQRTLVSIFSVPLSEFENRTVALVLLKSDDRKKDANNILNYLVKNVSFAGSIKSLSASARLF